jgi:hypothetical protein
MPAGGKEDRDIEAWFSRERRRACAGKRRFRSEAEASQAARLVLLEYGEELVAYRCRFCRQWHLGHRPSR